jgi:ABC-type Mn2+/Zn2+ transport system permease subunit/Mn-dependent DtxR family transcriptional regulator
MDGVLYALAEPWTHTYFVKAVVGGSIIAVTCAVLGCYIILRRMAFIGDAMSHALLPGVGVGYLVMNAVVPGGFTSGGLLLGALIAAALTSVSISALSRVSRIGDDTAIGIVYTGLFAAGVVILTRFQQYINIDLNHFFQGDVYGISWEDMWLSAVVGAVVLAGIVLFYRYFTLVSFDPTMAASLGFPTGLIHAFLTGMIAMVCVAGISMVGVIMIVGLLITPPALAYLLTDRLPRMMILAAVMAVVSVVLGLYFSEWVNASGGGAIMFTGFVLFLAGLVCAPRYGLVAGWLRRRRLVPQSDIEDALKAGLEGRAPAGLPVPRARLRRALRALRRQGLVVPATGGGIALSEQGRREAAHILRSHQLWEGHFIREGMPPAHAHAAAEQLEHLHDRGILDRFDDELDHPERDRDGEPIPPDAETDDLAFERD